MKVKKLYASLNTPSHFTVEMPDGKFYKFVCTRTFSISEKDLSPLPGFVPRGNNGKEAEPYLYKLYGLEKVEE